MGAAPMSKIIVCSVWNHKLGASENHCFTVDDLPKTFSDGYSNEDGDSTSWVESFERFSDNWIVRHYESRNYSEGQSWTDEFTRYAHVDDVNHWVETPYGKGEYAYRFIEYKHGAWAVYGVGIYPSSSVLAGQDQIVWLESYDTLEAAQTAFPEAQIHNALTRPQNYFNHLPDEGDE